MIIQSNADMPQPHAKTTPRTASPEVRRKQLVDATIACISRKGIAGTTLAAVTEEAGLSLGLVNFHFRSKDALLLETLHTLAQEHRRLWLRAVARDDLTPADKLAAIVSAQFHPRVCSRRKLRVWFAFFGDAAYRDAYRKGSAHIDLERRQTVTDLCRELSAGDGGAGPDADAVARAMESLFDGYWLNMLMYPGSFRREDGARLVTAYLASVFPGHFAGGDTAPG